jgi:hypothetical protein
MLRRIFSSCILAGCFASVSIVATAQQVVHALTGTVSSIDGLSKTVTVYTDSGSQSDFKDLTNSKTSMVLDKKIRAESTSADAFKKVGTYVIVFYFGDSDARTAVALRNLGTGPFTSSTGTVVKFESKAHSIVVKDNSGQVQTFKITSDTVAETFAGVVDGFKFQLQKGDQVRVVGATADGGPTALFVNQM